MLLYRTTALALAVVFAAVGAVFLLAPDAVLFALDRVAALVAWPAVRAGEIGSGLFRGLAVAYMYVVTLLAWMMFRRPAEPAWPTLLAHAKLASAAASALLFVSSVPSMEFAANAAVDGLIGVGVLLLRRQAIALQRRGRVREADHERAVVSS
jgi:hypothetical protein